MSLNQKEFLEKMVAVVPNIPQKHIEEMGCYSFVHFGMNTFTGKEWGNGKEPVSTFTLKNADTDQWCQSLKDAGMKGVIFTAKHHDGFCLWDTKTTDYNVMNSPYGRDVLAELRISCDKIGIELGVYLSPWDRNSEFYSTPKYNEFYLTQLEELLTGYGDLFTMWFDGACGAHMDGKPMQVYDFNSYYDLIRKLQPNCAISNCGPDVRWVGNEEGCARHSEYNVVPAYNADTQTIQSGSQQTDSGKFEKIDNMSEDLGSRKVLSRYEKLMWYPAEVDVSIRPGWFYHKRQDKKVKSVDRLLQIYYGSTGGNSMLLLNVPPNREGKLADADVKALKGMGERINSAFAQKMVVKKASGNIDVEFNKSAGIEVERIESQFQEYSITFDACDIDKAMLIEDINFSQRVEKYELYTIKNASKIVLFEGTVIGHKKIAMFDIINTDNLTLCIKESRLDVHLKIFDVFKTDYTIIKTDKLAKINTYFRVLGTTIYLHKLERAKAKSAKKLAKQERNNKI